MARALTLRAYAKINWSLEVGDVRPDGFHDVRTVLQSIDLADTIHVSPRRGPMMVTCDMPHVPAGRENLAWRAASVFWRALKRAGDPQNTRIAITKKIPVGAGLGGGSADAAATLVALNHLWGPKWRRPDLVKLAADVGSDVPFFLVGGTALALGRGEAIYPLEDTPPHSLIVIKPSIDVATADAYAWLDRDVRAGGLFFTTSDELDSLGWPAISLPIRNDLQKPVSRQIPVIGEMLEALRRAGTLVASMTGSGSAVFGVRLPTSRVSDLKTRAQEAGWTVFFTRTLTRRQAGRFRGL